MSDQQSQGQQSPGIILLVEDEPLVRLVAADLLSDAHFRVIEAADAEEALTVLKAGVPVDVVLSDVEMPPGIDGYDLAWEVHRRWPSVAIVIASGRKWPAQGDLPPGATFLAKPYSSMALLTRVLAAARTAQAARAERDGDAEGAGSRPKTA